MFMQNRGAELRQPAEVEVATGAPAVPAAPVSTQQPAPPAPAPVPPAQQPAVPAIVPPAAAAPVVATHAQEAAAAPLLATEMPDPDWLKPRLARAQEAATQKVLDRLGATDLETAAADIAAAAAAREATKSAEQRALEAGQRLATTSTEAQRYKALIGEQAGRMMMALSAEQQKAVKDFAGDDPAEQLRTIHHFQPTWTQQAQAAAQSAPAPLATSTPAPAAPVETAPGSPPDVKATYQTTKQANPFAAAKYGSRNGRVYE